MGDFLQADLGSTLLVECNSHSHSLEVSLDDYDLPESGRFFTCPLSGNRSRRFDLPIVAEADRQARLQVRQNLDEEARVSPADCTLYGGGEGEPFKDWLQFFLELRERSRKSFRDEWLFGDPSGLPELVMAWPNVFSWLEELSSLQDPPYEPIVEVAESSWETVESLFKNPRRVLRRERRSVPLGRLDEVDEGCIRWMVRQPGRNLAERAGAKQQLLGVVREDNFDTLENRVLKDFGIRADFQAGGYANRYRARKGSQRWRMVDRYRKMIREAGERSEVRAAATLQTVPNPNFVLQFDRAYKRTWEWYLMLVRREEQVDRARLWRSRLWRDRCHLLLAHALAVTTSFKVNPRGWCRVLREQDRGAWMKQTNPALFKNSEDGRIAQIVTADFPVAYGSLLEGRFGDHFGCLGAGLALVVWKPHKLEPVAVFFFVTEPRPLSSWTDALRERHEALTNRVNRLKAKIRSSVEVCVLVPSVQGKETSGESIEGSAKVVELPSSDEGWTPDARLDLAAHALSPVA